MTALVSLIGGWPAVIAFALAIVSGIAALFKHQQLQTARAEAATANAKAETKAVEAEVAKTDAAAATDALNTIQAASDIRTTVEAEVAAMPAGESEKELRRDFQRD